MRCARLAAPILLVAACTSGRSAEPTATPPPSRPPTTTSAAPAATDDWPTYHRDAARTGVHPTFPAATGRLRVVAAIKMDAKVYASPIVARGLTVVATEQNSVYALDDSGRQRWRVNLGTPAKRSDLPCGNIDPSGITGTPVYDAESGSVFAVAEHRAPVRHELVALDAATGAIRSRMSVDLPGADPAAMQERGALTIAAGRVWVPFGGRSGDCGDYKGRVVGVPTSGGTPIVYTVPTGREAGIWTPPGPSLDRAGHLLVSVGNGESGSNDAYDHSDSVLEIDPANARLLDSFSPTTWATDNEGDLDLGSQGPTLVGESWIFIAGKSGEGYVLRQGRLGGIGGQVSKADLCKSFGGTAVVGDTVYVPCDDGLRAVRIASNGSMTVRWHAAESIAGSPVVGGGRIWVLNQDAGRLHALDPATGRSMAQIAVGSVTRFATPALHGSHILVPTEAGLTIVASGD